jgi:hypothetical protein
MRWIDRVVFRETREMHRLMMFRWMDMLFRDITAKLHSSDKEDGPAL